MKKNNKQEESLTPEEIDAVLKQWRQGDFVLDDQTFVYRLGAASPKPQPRSVVSGSINTHIGVRSWLSNWFLEFLSRKFHYFRTAFYLEGNIQEDYNQGVTDLEEIEVRGLVVVTQTCDIVRDCNERRFVQVAPLKEVDETRLSEIQKGMRPQYAFIPGASVYCLVADLDCVMTVEKSVVARWQHNIGCTTDKQVRALSQALTRKLARFAFPNDFIEIVKKLQKQIKDKHNKPSSDEGQALRALREIRVQASPSWNNPEIELFFWFVRYEEQTEFGEQKWYELKEKWVNLIPRSGRFTFIDGIVVTLEDMTAKDYVESDPLDLDNLSS